MYHDFEGREIEDMEMDNMCRDARQASKVKRVRIQETNEIASSFNTTVEYMSDELPDWFNVLQPVIEDDGFTNMTIAIKDVHYLISLADTEPRQPEDSVQSDVIESYKAIETAIQLLAANVINLRTELLTVKANINRIAENTSTELEP